ncbi:MAG: ATP-binding protein [Bacteroidales bacterium]|jgi:AAA+ ATPase superfamily predicted ATPase|nr:ATP-binding protein [Bacteroidales bacterium]
MDKKIIGRQSETQKLTDLYNSENAEFIAVCGRRRVGKTFLIRQLFGNRLIFDLAGLANTDTKTQLANFNLTLNRCFNKQLPVAKNWLYAFEQLIAQLKKSRTKRKVVFIDEISWLDTPRAGFLTALEHFWNGWACGRDDIMLIICGSATSWITNKIINNHGGLHNRLTATLFLQPFNISETEQYFLSHKIMLGRQEIAEAYMIFGGIPYYLSLFEKGLSLSQNIDNLCFKQNAKLKNEFSNLYASLFRKSENYVATVSALSLKNKGLTRGEISEITKKSGRELTEILINLESCGFIRSYNALHKKKRDRLYQLLDAYTLFYFNFLENYNSKDENFWTNSLNTPLRNTWAGYAFESLVLQHVSEIKRTLGISGVQSGVSAWATDKTDNYDGCQIDLLIDRKDGVINICEMKFSNSPFIISKAYEANLRNKLAAFEYVSKTKKALHLTFITTFGVVHNKRYSIVQKEITLDDIFL